MAYVYLYSDPSIETNGLPEKLYVGKGSKPSRALSHLKRTDKHPFVRRLIKMRKLGIDPVITYLATDIDDELAFLVEMEAISLYGRRNLGTGTLHNLTNGGEGVSGRVLSDQSRAKLSNSLKNIKRTPEQMATLVEQCRNKFMGNKTRLGSTHSDETKARISKSQFKPCTINGIDIFNSVTALIRKLGQGKKGYKHPNFHFIEGAI